MLTQYVKTSNKKKQLEVLCKVFGIRLDLAQAGGGNISVKDHDLLFIKSSGMMLFDVAENNCAAVFLSNKLKNFTRNDEKIDEFSFLYDSCISSSTQPSIETFLHTMTKTYTVHLHPVALLQAMGQEDFKDKLQKKYGDDIAFVSYHKPGLALARSLPKKLPTYIVLEKHGLIVHSDEFEDLEPLVYEFTDFCRENAHYSGGREVELLSYTKATKFQELMFKETNKIMYVMPVVTFNVAEDMRQSPDCVVYCGKKTEIKNEKDVKNTSSLYECCNCTLIMGDTYLKCKMKADVAYMYSNFAYDAECLSVDEADELLEWNSEKFRS